MSARTDTVERQRMVLRETLRLAVPLHIHDLRDRTPSSLAALAERCADTIAAHGDDLQYGGKHCRETFNALARGLAAAALTADGGADFLDLHWCADPACRAESRFDHADPDWDEPWPPDPDEPPEPAARPIHTLLDLSAWPPTTV